MEIFRKQNTDTRIVFPIMKTDGTFITSAAGLDSEYALVGAHGGTAPAFQDCTHEATEIGATGLYYLDVSAAEVNDDYGSTIQIKSSTTGAITQVININTESGSKLSKLYQAFTGTWEITGNQLIIYDSDGTTALFTYNLTQDGIGTEFNPDKRSIV